MPPITVGISGSASSGVQGGDISTGGVIVGGSGGANKAPTWLFVAAGIAALVALGALLFLAFRK